MDVYNVKPIRLISNIDDAATDSTSYVKLDRLGRVHNVFIKCTGTGLSTTNISDLKVSANDTVIQRGDGLFFDRLSRYENYQAFGGTGDGKNIIRIPFARSGLLDRAQEVASALNVGGRDSNGVILRHIALEIDWGTLPADFKAEVWAEMSDGHPAAGIGVVRRIIRVPNVSLPAGESELTDFTTHAVQTPTRVSIGRHWLQMPTTNLIHAEVEINNKTYASFDPQMIDYLNDRKFVNSTDFVCLDGANNGYGGSAFPLRDIVLSSEPDNPLPRRQSVQDYRLLLELAAADTINHYFETYGSF